MEARLERALYSKLKNFNFTLQAKGSERQDLICAFKKVAAEYKDHKSQDQRQGIN